MHLLTHVCMVCSANKPLGKDGKGWTTGDQLNFYAAVRESRTGEIPCDTQLQVAFENQRREIRSTGSNNSRSWTLTSNEEWTGSKFFVNITGVPPKGTCDSSQLPRRNVRVPLPPGAANYKVWRMRLRVTEPGAIEPTTPLNREVTEVHGFNITVKHYQQNVRMPVQWVGLRSVTITGEENYISQYYLLLILLFVVAMVPTMTIAIAAFLERYFPGGGYNPLALLIYTHNRSIHS